MMWDTYNARSLTLLGSDFGINLHFLDPLYANTSTFENATDLEIGSTHMTTSRWYFWAFQMLFIGLRTLRLHHIVSGHMRKVQIWNESRWDELSTPVNRIRILTTAPLLKKQWSIVKRDMMTGYVAHKMANRAKTHTISWTMRKVLLLWLTTKYYQLSVGSEVTHRD